jgi:hypothetical protein
MLVASEPAEMISDLGLSMLSGSRTPQKLDQI